LNIFETYKKLFWNKILALLRSIFGDFFMTKILPKSLGDFFWKKFCHKKSPKWQNFAQSGHPDAKAPIIPSLFLSLSPPLSLSDRWRGCAHTLHRSEREREGGRERKREGERERKQKVRACSKRSLSMVCQHTWLLY
jgi:hypothetical protein